MEYTICNMTDETFITLITCLDTELVQRYGAEQVAYHPHNVVECGEAIIASEADLPVACGCFRLYDNETVEIKRMYAKPEYRGKGIARELLVRLERHAAVSGYRAAVLETGRKQPEAIRLYEKSGYVQTPNYGPYVDIPNSICFKKIIHQAD